MKPEAVEHWMRSRAEQWRDLNGLLDEQRDKRDQDIGSLRRLVQGFRALARDLSLARSALPDSRVARYIETLFLRTHDAIYRKPQALWPSLKSMYLYEVPAATRRLRGVILATAGWFILSGIAGWLLVWFNPELESLFASPGMIDGVQRGELWTDDLLNVVPSSILSLQLMTNNISVSLFAFALGAFYGVGTIYIIGLNGLMLGGIFAFTAQYGMAERLLSFVFAHGVVELSVIVLAGAAGIQLGEALIRPGMRTRVAAFEYAVGEAGKLLMLVAPALVGAGLIEGYVSPDDSYSMQLRVTIGLCYGFLVWAALTGRLWRFGKGA